MSANKPPKLGENSYKRIRSIQIRDKEATFDIGQDPDYLTTGYIKEWDEIKNDPVLSKYIANR